MRTQKALADGITDNRRTGNKFLSIPISSYGSTFGSVVLIDVTGRAESVLERFIVGEAVT